MTKEQIEKVLAKTPKAWLRKIVRRTGKLTQTMLGQLEAEARRLNLFVSETKKADAEGRVPEPESEQPEEPSELVKIVLPKKPEERDFLPPEILHVKQAWGRLVAKKCAVSNSLHGLKTKTERKHAAELIETYRREINELRDLEDYFLRTGLIPEELRPNDEIKDYDFETLRTKRDSAKRRRNRIKKKIADARKSKDPKRLKKISKWAQDLSKAEQNFEELHAAYLAQKHKRTK